ncbi:MAG: Patatin [Anaerolineaceae bacterium]|nr:MAG: Patatin [Anaerolineaceae bacterium]
MDISLALGGGGSRGNAHIGVIRRLEREGYRVRAVAGTSAGGIVAAAYAAGYTPDEMEAIFAKVDQSKLFGRGSHEGPALLGLSGAAKALEEFLGHRTFADLKIPCAMMAVDVNAGCEVVIHAGRLVDAVLATIAIPAIFPPQPRGDALLVDGGVLDPVPVRAARALAPTLPVVAVVLSPLVKPTGNLLHAHLPVKLPAPIVSRLTRTRLAQAFNIFLQSTEASSRMLTELRLEVDNPEVVIRPDVGGIGMLDKVDVHEVVRLGEEAAESALSDLRRAVAWPRRVRRRMFPRK